MSRNILLGLITLLILIAAGFAIYNSRNQTPPPSSPSGSSSSAAAPVATVTVIYDGTGFNPSSVTIKSGETVAFKNDSNAEIQVDSNPHPIHTDDTDLNIGAIAPGQTGTAVLTKVGTFGYHNHLNPSQTGTIIVTP